MGFTEVTGTGRLYNTAAVFHKGSVIGLYRKLHPAINRSIYDAGDQMPVFRVGGLMFGIVICNDSNYPEPARVMASKGATALFIRPTTAFLRRRRVSPHPRGVSTSPWRWRTTSASSVLTLPVARMAWCRTDRPKSSIRMAMCFSQRSH